MSASDFALFKDFVNEARAKSGMAPATEAELREAVRILEDFNAGWDIEVRR